MTILYLCFNPSSPFVTAPPPPHNSTTPYALTDPVPDRGWFNWNGGRLFDPPLVGYQPVRPASSSPSAESAISSPSATDRSSSTAGASSGITPAEHGMPGMPSGYYDFSWKGLGFVVDLGWRRTEDGMRWEGNVGSWEPRKRDNVAAEVSASEGETANDEVKVDAGDGAKARDAADTGTDSPQQGLDASKKDVEIAKGRGWRWTRSFVGDL